MAIMRRILVDFIVSLPIRSLDWLRLTNHHSNLPTNKNQSQASCCFNFIQCTFSEREVWPCPCVSPIPFIIYLFFYQLFSCPVEWSWNHQSSFSLTVRHEIDINMCEWCIRIHPSDNYSEGPYGYLIMTNQLEKCNDYLGPYRFAILLSTEMLSLIWFFTAINKSLNTIWPLRLYLFKWILLWFSSRTIESTKFGAYALEVQLHEKKHAMIHVSHGKKFTCRCYTVVIFPHSLTQVRQLNWSYTTRHSTPPTEWK